MVKMSRFWKELLIVQGLFGVFAAGILDGGILFSCYLLVTLVACFALLYLKRRFRLSVERYQSIRIVLPPVCFGIAVLLALLFWR